MIGAVTQPWIPARKLKNIDQLMCHHRGYCPQHSLWRKTYRDVLIRQATLLDLWQVHAHIEKPMP